ncbi:hypothetical protein DY218_28590 [Streptomyces triticagri]|uniref:Uncharacterized protein n=1 Tax=Streptomyces triticagri TaxID=2293568 RepID=A0A372LX71_9ACTN|nr:hypothetical protein [Streptomyces triticagri]RFU83268.1 hypothetical protein DY218_28590 [Streptomyces triticagri]
MARTVTPRRASHYPIVDDRRAAPCRLTVHQATAAIRSARRVGAKTVDAVHVYACTARNGEALHIAYVHYTPGLWTGVTDVADIYEIPTAALTDL